MKEESFREEMSKSKKIEKEAIHSNSNMNMIKGYKGIKQSH